jgi:hypothetical protein
MVVVAAELFIRTSRPGTPSKAVSPAPGCGQQIGQMKGYEHWSRRRARTTKNSEAAGPLVQSPKRYGEHQGYRAGTPDRPASSMAVLIGSALVAAAILLSALVSAVGTRFAGLEAPGDDNMWLIDRLTGSVYKCQASERGRASCEPEPATGSVGQQPKR